MISEAERRLISTWRVARLATVDSQGSPSAVPICFAFDGQHLNSVLDRKPKSVQPDKLKRVRNIRSNPQVSVVLDSYDEDWGSLWYILIRGAAEILYRGMPGHGEALALLRMKYSQYWQMDIDDSPVIRITIERGNKLGPATSVRLQSQPGREKTNLCKIIAKIPPSPAALSRYTSGMWPRLVMLPRPLFMR